MPRESHNVKGIYDIGNKVSYSHQMIVNETIPVSCNNALYQHEMIPVSCITARYLGLLK